MKKIIYSLGMLAIGIIMFLLTIRFIGLDAIIQQFKTIKPHNIIFYLLISIALVTVHVLEWKLILKAQGHEIPFRKLFMYRQMGYAVGYVIPSFYIGGETVRVFFLKREKVSITDAISSIILDRAIELPMNFLMALVMFFLIAHTIQLPRTILVGAGIILTVLLVFGIIFYYKMYQKEHFFTRIFELFGLQKNKRFSKYRKNIVQMESNLIRFFNHKKKFILYSLLVSILYWILMIFEYNTALTLVGFKPTLAQIYLVVTMIGFSMMFPVPASIGILELGQIGLAILVGIPPQVAVAMSILVRTRDFMWILLGIIFFFYHGTSYLRTLLEDVTNGKNKKSS